MASQAVISLFGSGDALPQRQNRVVKHANRIRELRKARDWTLEYLAERMDMSPSFVSRIERGERNLTLKQMDAFARAFGIQPTELLPSPDTDGGFDHWLRRFVENLDGEEKERLKTIIEAAFPQKPTGGGGAGAGFSGRLSGMNYHDRPRKLGLD